MSGLLIPLAALMLIWMGFCAWVGFQGRYFRFAAILLCGLALNMLWIVFGLRAQPFEANAVMAQAAAAIYALCAFGMGVFAGRIRRAWRESRVEDAR